MPPHVVQNIIEMIITSASVLSLAGIASWTILRMRQPRAGVPASRELAALHERLARLEQAVDAVALEVERGGEAQRFTAHLLAERLGAGERAGDRLVERVGERSSERAGERALGPHRPTPTPH